MKQPAVHITASDRNGTLYVGVTSNLIQRAWQHRNATFPGFAARNGCSLLVWFEGHPEMIAAITLEKQIEAGSRARKMGLIQKDNPTWRDLYPDIV